MGGHGYAGGHFKSDILKNLKFNRRGISIVKTKSSYETNFINFFENNNICWDYECEEIYITCNNSKRKTIPDFFIYEKDELKKVIEVKGYISDIDFMIEKVFETNRYYENKNVPYYFYKMSDIHNIEDIESCCCYKKNKNEISKIVKG